jgi:DNA polymerase-3 subunit epsilon
MSKFLVIDTETTGLDPTSNQIIQLGAIVYNDKDEKESFSLSVTYNDHGTIEPAAFSKNKTGIAGYMASELFNESVAIYKFCDFVLKNPCDYLVGFNVQFDLAFLRAAFERAKVNFVNFLPYKVIDPFVTAQMLILTGNLPSTMKTNLSALCKHYDINSDGAHEAMADIRMTYSLMTRMMQQLSK